MKIGKIKLEGKLILAPMYLITDAAFRELCKNNGASLVYSEMVSADAILKNNKKTLDMIKTTTKQRPFAIQLFGSNPEKLAKAAKKIEKKANIIDLNFGCPSDKITDNKSGAALLKNPKKIYEIITSVKNAVKIPVTCKIRLGINDKKNAIKIAKVIEKAGVDAISVHGRTLKQGYSGKVDLNMIKKIKQQLKIPVIGNGDIVDGKTALNFLEKTKCDAIMIGRGAIGNPFIFDRINYFLKEKKDKKSSDKDKLNLFFEYVKLAEKYKISSIQKIKMHALWFTKGMKNSAKIRNIISKSKTKIKILKEIKNYARFLEENSSRYTGKIFE